MANIYVSSTFKDLEKHREVVREQLRKLGHVDVAMEYYGASDQRPADKCLKDVESSDAYLGIFAFRHGFVPNENNPNGESITEMEYRHALAAGKPCFIFLLDEDAPWPMSLADKDRTRIEVLRLELANRHVVSFFQMPEKLCAEVATALAHFNPTPGAPRAPQVGGLNVGAYSEMLRKRYLRLDLDSLTPPQREDFLPIPLQSVFVEPFVRASPPPVEIPKDVLERLAGTGSLGEALPAGLDEKELRQAISAYQIRPKRPVLDVLLDPTLSRTIVLGDPGAGKSTLTRYIVLALADPAGDPRVCQALQGYIPIIIELRSYAGLRAENRCETFLEYLDYLSRTAEGIGLPKDALEAYLKDGGRAVVLFDGLDEIFDSEDRERITRQVAGFARNYPGCRVVITSRVIGYSRKILEDEGFAHFTLQDLEDAQVNEFLAKWYAVASPDMPDKAQQQRERILKAMEGSRSLRQLAGNPLLLTILAIIGKHKELPRERWRLYEHATGVLIQHWDVNKHLREHQVNVDFIDEEDRRELLRRVAFRMQSRQRGLAGNYIEKEELRSEFEAYLVQRHDLPKAQSAHIARVMIEQFRTRNFILSLYGANLYGFVHRAFLEYFCASSFVHKFEKTREIDIDQLQRVFGEHWSDPSWHEVLRLICAMIDDRFTGSLIQTLLDVRLPPPSEDGLRPPEHLALATQCLNEVRNIGDLSEVAARLLDELLKELEKTTQSPTFHPDWASKEISPYVEAIGARWPYRERIVIWLEKLALGPVTSNYANTIARFIIALGSNLDSIHRIIWSYVNGSYEQARVLAIHVLQPVWGNTPEIRAILRKLVDEDEGSLVRTEALVAFVDASRSDPEVFDLLMRKVEDADSLMRHTALRLLVNWSEDISTVWSTIKKHAEMDPHPYVRTVALLVAVQKNPYYPEVLPLLLERAEQDLDPSMDVVGGFRMSISTRFMCLLQLLAFWPDRPEIIEFVCRRAREDPHPVLRSKLARLLEERHENVKAP